MNDHTPPLPNKSVQMETVRLRDATGLIVWLDTPERSVNVLDQSMLEGLEAAVEHAAAIPNRYSFVMFRSKKQHCFFVGADVQAIAGLKCRDDARKVIIRGQALMHKIAVLPMPTVAVIQGVCMGGGLELALACRYRVAFDSVQTKFGLPEIKLGLIPGWGGTQRLPNIVGLRQALTMILTGRTQNTRQALKTGLIDAVFSSDASRADPLEFLERAVTGNRQRTCKRKWLTYFTERFWLSRQLVFSAAKQKIAGRGDHYPALAEAIAAVKAGCASGGNSYQEEREAFVRLVFSETAESLIGLFLQRDRAKKTTTWTDQRGSSQARRPIQNVAVIGAGAMGAGIGALAAIKGFSVIFKEIHDAAADSGRKRVQDLLDQYLERGHISQREWADCRQRIQFTTRWDTLANCDLAIEAVLEMETVKREVFEMLDRSLHSESILVSNTSSLCVTRMASATHRRHRVAGLHFFNPVDRMDLVEVIRTESTSEDTLTGLLDFVRALGKTPIVTSDKPGFLVNRVLFPYLGEAIRMVSEGYEIRLIDRQMREFGMPMGPLELIDQVGVDIAHHVAQSLAEVQTDAQIPVKILSRMVNNGWLGKKTQCGFYHYHHSELVNANGALLQEAIAPRLGISYQRDTLSNCQRRLVYPMLNEAVHCLDELVVTEPWMVDLGMVLGIGFAPHYGGPLRLIDLLKPETVLRNLLKLADSHGERFQPADGLQRVVRTRSLFFGENSLPQSLENDHESRYPTLS